MDALRLGAAVAIDPSCGTGSCGSLGTARQRIDVAEVASAAAATAAVPGCFVSAALDADASRISRRDAGHVATARCLCTLAVDDDGARVCVGMDATAAASPSTRATGLDHIRS